MLSAFTVLIGTKQYDEITIGDIVKQAAVSRSSFYEYFGGKRDLLAQSIASPFKALASNALSTAQPSLVPLLEHFWSNRAFARALLTGSSRQPTVTVLVHEIDQILKRRESASRAKFRLPRRLIAWQLAESMLGVITAWLLGEARCPAPDLADGLAGSSRAVLEMMKVSN